MTPFITSEREIFQQLHELADPTVNRVLKYLHNGTYDTKTALYHLFLDAHYRRKELQEKDRLTGAKEAV